MATRTFFVSVLLIAAGHCQDFTSVVQTDKGPVVGRHWYSVWHSKKYSSFLSIPFAQPPVGPMRFKDPVECAPWTEVYNATDEAPICAQNLIIHKQGQEDCLYLNVQTPLVDFENITELLPVMVWIYGGGFLSGTSRTDVYDGQFFVEQNVLFVSMNYRLDAFGGLNLNIPGAMGNQGLKDQHMALQWVQKNIAAFGGDPKQVTLFGESAGSASVGFQLISPKSQGLFHKVIMQSGTPLCPWAYKTPSDSKQTAFTLCRNLGKTTIVAEDCLNYLMNLTPTEILNVTQFMVQGVDNIRFPFVPSMDNDFLPDCPISILQSGNYSHLPVLMGFNLDESLLFYIVNDIIRTESFDASVILTNQIPIVHITPLLSLGDQLSNATLYQQIQTSSLHDFYAPIDLMERYMAEHATVYYYRMSVDEPYNLHKALLPDLNGTSHADDLGYIFNFPILYPYSPDNYINRFRYKVVSYWVNFAKYGNPTPAGQTFSEATWEEAGATGKQLDINLQSTMHDRLLDSAQISYEKSYRSTLPLATGCTNFNILDPSPF